MRRLHTQSHILQSHLASVLPAQHRLPATQKLPSWNRRLRAFSSKNKAASNLATAVSDAEPPSDSTKAMLVQLNDSGGIAEPMSEETAATEQQRRGKLWFAAIKPPMYTVSIIPVLVSLEITLVCLYAVDCISAGFNSTQVSAAAAYAATGTVSLSKCLQLNLASILIILWLNLR